jgi:phosphoribosyl-AMP cyclohydrolase
MNEQQAKTQEVSAEDAWEQNASAEDAWEQGAQEQDAQKHNASNQVINAQAASTPKASALHVSSQHASQPDPSSSAWVAKLGFDEQGLIPAIVQQYDSGEVLMMAWMNAESLLKTCQTCETWFWSRSRLTLWHKGATSGNIQKVRAIYSDCDADCLLLLVDSPGPACHTGARSCFFTEEV